MRRAAIVARRRDLGGDFRAVAIGVGRRGKLLIGKACLQHGVIDAGCVRHGILAAAELVEVELVAVDHQQGRVWGHAEAVAAILAEIGGSQEMQAAAYLVYACPHLNKPEEVMAKAFGENLAQLSVQTNQLLHLQRLSRAAAGTAQHGRQPHSKR